MYNAFYLSILSDRLVGIFKNSIVSIDYAGNILVMKTLTGSAQAAAAAIDAVGLDEIVGTIAGDDTIFLLIRDADKIEEIIKHFRELMK
jgi:transcriptional regulator of arginine metabolism